MVDPVFLDAAFPAGEGRQRHPRAGGGDQLDLVQRLRVLGVLRVDLHHHAVLVEAVVDGRHLALAEGVVQHPGDHAHVHAQPLGGVAVDHQANLLGALGFLGIDIGQLRQCAQRFTDTRQPFAQLVEIAGEQHVLVLRAAPLAPADLQVLVGHQEHASSGDFRYRAAQAIDHLLRGDVALGDRLEAHDHEGVVDPPATADEPGHAFHRGVCEHRAPVDFHLRLHDLERQAVVAADHADQLAGVLLRQEGFRHADEQEHVQRDGRQQAEQHQQRMLQRAIQAASVKTQHAFLQAAAETLQGVRLAPRLFGLEPARTEHRRQGQGHQQRDHDGHRQGDGKLAEQALDDTAHEQDREKHRDQRQVHREQGETHLACALECGVHRRFAGFYMPRDVLQHDDGVVHHEAGGDDQRHQRQVVQREAQQVHGGEGADQRHRHRQRRDQRRAPTSEEGEHHQNHQGHGDHQGALGLVQGGADHRRTIHRHFQVDAGRDYRAQRRQLLADAGDGFDDIRPGLPVDHQQHGLFVVIEATVVAVLHRVADARHIAQAHGGAVLVADDYRHVVGGFFQLVAGLHLPVTLGVFHRAFRPFGVGRGDRLAHFVQGDAVLVEQTRFQGHAHRR
ncbi:hypothetical protein FQZ97_718380 [compost metagenome]